MTTGRVALDVTQYVRVNNGLNPMALQAHRDTVRLTFSDEQPSKSNTAFHEIGGGDAIYRVPTLDTNVWVLAVTDRSALTVTELTNLRIGETTVAVNELAAKLHTQHQTDKALQREIIRQLRLLNARIEESFGSKINEGDIT